MGLLDGIQRALGWGGSSTSPGSADEGTPPHPADAYKDDASYMDRPPLLTDEDHVTYVKTHYEDFASIKYPYEPVWWLDMAHYLGQQWTRWAESERTLRPLPAPSHRVRMVINRIQPLVKVLLGKFLRGAPHLICSPTDTTDTARAEARVSERLLKALWDHCGMYNVLHDAMLWAITCGTGFIRTGWDPALGDYVLDDQGRPMYTGDLEMMALSPYQVFVPRYQKDLLQPSRVIEASIYPLEQIKQQYPETSKDLRPDATLKRMGFYEDRVAALVSPIGALQTLPDIARDRSVFKISMWEDPQTLTPWEREQYPTGRLTVVANEQLLFVGRNPFADGKQPIVRLRGGVFPGRFWGTSVVENLIPIQKAYNKARSQMMEARNLTAAPQVVAPKGNEVVKQTNEPGSWLEYRHSAGPAPSYMVPPQMNQWMQEDIKALGAEFQDVGQVKEVSQGGLPAANLTGVAINLLQEADNTPWGPIATELAIAIGQVGQKMLARAAQGYIEPRLFTAVDELDQDDVFEFMSHGELLPVKVRCDVTSLLPESTAARMSRVEALINSRVLDPVRDRSEILRLMEFGNVESLWMQEDADRRKAQRENKRMAKGQPMQVASFDDHAIHLVELNQYRKGTEYESLPPEIQAIFQQHAQIHQMALAQEQAAMQPAAAPAGPPSGQSGPTPESGPNGGPSGHTGLGSF